MSRRSVCLVQAIIGGVVHSCWGRVEIEYFRESSSCGVILSSNICLPVPVAAGSMAWVCGYSSAEIVSSSPTGGMDVCLSWVLSVVRSLRRADHSSRRVLPTVVYRCVWCRNVVKEETLAQWGLSRQKQTSVWWGSHVAAYLQSPVGGHREINRAFYIERNALVSVTIYSRFFIISGA